LGWTCGTHLEGRVVYRVLVGRTEGKSHWEDLGLGGIITFKGTIGT